MKKKFLFCAFAFLGILLNAQQLYFIRAEVGDGYQYYELPPTQIIAYTPHQDTLLHVYKDHTYNLPYSYKMTSIDKLEFYSEYNAFIFKVYGNGFKSYVLYTANPDTLIEMPAHCPRSYSVSPFLSMNIVNNHWAYECSCDDNNVADIDYALFKGIDFSLSNHFDMSASDFKDLYLTGVVAQLTVLKPNDGRMYLPIVSGIEDRPPFSVELPQKYWIEPGTNIKEAYRLILVNDSHKTLVRTKRVNPTKDEDYGHFYAALYNKNKDTWSDIELKGNSPAIMTYGRWLAGVVQDETDSDTRFIIGYKISPGKTVRDSVYMENSFDEQAGMGTKQTVGKFYRPGILYLFNTETEKYIEWETKQGDSEILLVQDETVYYRVFDAIYKVPVVNGEKLGKAELLVKDRQVVPYIHWAFFGKEMNCFKTD